MACRTRVSSWEALLLAALALAPLASARAQGTPTGTTSVLQWIQELQRLEADQAWEKRLELARAGLVQFEKHETLPQLLVLTLSALGDYANYRGATDALDAEARRYYRRIVESAGDVETPALAEHALALYYSKTSRPGASLPHLERELRYYQSADDPVQTVLVLGSLAAAYGDMGELALETHFRRQALELAKQHFILGLRPPPGNAWIAYTDLLMAQMGDVAVPGRQDEILALWKTAKPIYYAYLLPHKGLLNVANDLTLAGDRSAAEPFLEKAFAEAERFISRHPELAERTRRDLVCVRAGIETFAGRYAEAVKLHDQCAAATQALLGEEDMPGDINAPRIRALAYEGAGDLDRAIALYKRAVAKSERGRASFEVAQRATFFRTVVRTAYWGLIRTLAKRAAATRDEDDFLHALQASELVRGRQLGEILDPEGDPTLGIAMLARVRAGLRAGEVMIDTVLTDREIVVFAIARDDWAVAVVPYDARAFAKQARDLAADLARPASALGPIDDRLARISDQIFAPVAPLVRGAATLVLLPDGALNLVPPGLLRAPGASEPLIRQRVVRIAPSLRFVLQAASRAREAQGGALFALADPVYRSSLRVPGLDARGLRSALRGSDYLSYFAALPETRTEVEAISRLFEAQPVEVLLGREASESSLKAADLRPFRFVHLATHGILGGEVPGVSEPALVLAEEPREDGFLTASEASALRLDAELTVLSACKTGTGEYVTGEGVLGMSRAFLAAGSRSVLVSLWSVDSRATEDLMVRFYHQLQSGVDAPEALRRAQLELIDEAEKGQGRLRGAGRVESASGEPGPLHPFYWAAFILVGA